MRLGSPMPGATLPEVVFDDLIKPFGLSPDDALALAVSGGPDSMALLVLAAQEARRSGRQIHALTVDHGLRAEARAEALQVGAWAKALGVPHAILTHAGARPTVSIQSAARDIRYRLMGEWCDEHGIAGLLVAHTQDDQAETLLLRLARGSGVDGLSGMAADATRDGLRILRPLLTVPRQDLLALLEAHRQDYVSDPSNDDAQHARVRMRALRPLLEAEGLTAQRLAETAARLAMARDALTGWTNAHIMACTQFDAGGWARIDRARFVDVPMEIGLRSLSRMVMAISGAAYPPRLHHTRSLLERLHQSDFSGATLGGVRFAARKDAVFAFREQRAIAPFVSLGGGGSLVWDGRFEVSALTAASSGGEDRSVGPLGSRGARQLRDSLGGGALPVPQAALACVPAVYCGPSLVEVPTLGFGADGHTPRHHVAFLGPMRAGIVSEPILEFAGGAP